MALKLLWVKPPGLFIFLAPSCWDSPTPSALWSRRSSSSCPGGSAPGWSSACPTVWWFWTGCPGRCLSHLRGGQDRVSRLSSLESRRVVVTSELFCSSGALQAVSESFIRFLTCFGRLGSWNSESWTQSRRILNVTKTFFTDFCFSSFNVNESQASIKMYAIILFSLLFFYQWYYCVSCYKLWTEDTNSQKKEY